MANTTNNPFIPTIHIQIKTKTYKKSVIIHNSIAHLTFLLHKIIAIVKTKIRTITIEIMDIREMTLVMVEASDFQTCLKDRSQPWDIECTRNPISIQVVVGLVTTTIFIIMILLQIKIKPILREIRKKIKFITADEH